MCQNGAWKSYRIYYGDTFGYGEGSYFGQSIATVRDLNNDTYFELAVGAPGTEGGGSIMLLHMEDEGMVGNYTMLNASTLDFRYLASTWDERERCATTRLPRRLLTLLSCSLALLPLFFRARAHSFTR